MPPDRSLTLLIDPDLASRLAIATERTGLDAVKIALLCLRDHLDEVTAYGRLVDEIAEIKGHLAKLAELVGEALAEPTPAVVGEFCRYKPGKAARTL